MIELSKIGWIIMKRSKYILLIVFFALLYILPKEVFATPSLSYKTNISNWKGSNELVLSIPSLSNEFERRLYLSDGTTTIEITNITTTCLQSVAGFSDGSDLVLEEVISLATIPSVLGVHTGSVSPISFALTSEYDDYSTKLHQYIFQNYTSAVPNQTVGYTILNELDEYNNPTGNTYLSDFYFDIDDSKAVEISQGTIAFPSLCNIFSFAVKGNIADTNGTFQLTNTGAVPINVSFATNHEYTSTSITDFSAFYGFFLDHTGKVLYVDSANESDDYDITVTESSSETEFNDALTYDGNETFCLSYDVEALAEIDASNTGIFYDLWPFLIVIVLVGLGIFVFYKSKLKSDVNIV